MASISFYLTTILILHVFFQLSIADHTDTSKLIGFSTYLIHRDSFESPMFDPFVSQTNLIERAIVRSKSRLSQLKSILKLSDNAKEISRIESRIVKTTSDYLMEIYVGTPPVKQLAAFDTGSDIIWTQCLPCIKCYEQIQPIFDWSNSMTYSVLPCNASKCRNLGRNKVCKEDNEECQYLVTYMDNSYTYGHLALETFKIGNTLLPNMVYGCSHISEGKFKNHTAGIIGLGRGPLSLVSQLDNLIHGKFSYCLVNWMERNTSSKIIFGVNANVSGLGTISTPLVSKEPFIFYHITLEAISIQNRIILFKRIDKSIENKKIIENGNMVIDTGAVQTYLPRDMYRELENALVSVIQAIPVQDPKGRPNLCYNISTNIQIPTIIFHLAGGAELALTRRSTMFQIGDLTCLVIVPTEDDADQGVYGQFLQMDYLIGYDLKNWRIFFKPTNCSSHQI